MIHGSVTRFLVKTWLQFNARVRWVANATEHLIRKFGAALSKLRNQYYIRNARSRAELSGVMSDVLNPANRYHPSNHQPVRIISGRRIRGVNYQPILPTFVRINLQRISLGTYPYKARTIFLHRVTRTTVNCDKANSSNILQLLYFEIRKFFNLIKERCSLRSLNCSLQIL